jgi:hypothetical protein
VAHFSSESLLPDTADYYHFDEQLQALSLYNANQICPLFIPFIASAGVK